MALGGRGPQVGAEVWPELVGREPWAEVEVRMRWATEAEWAGAEVRMVLTTEGEVAAVVTRAVRSGHSGGGRSSGENVCVDSGGRRRRGRPVWCTRPSGGGTGSSGRW
jgi:hypothetical protein